MTTPGGASAQAIVAALRAGGMTQTDIAKATGISARMLRFVQAGAKPGTSYVPALQQLATAGRVTTPPPVRAQRVRAPGGATVPAKPRSRPAPAKPGAFGTSTTYVAGGRGRVVDITAPRSNGAGRDAARAEVLNQMRSAALGRRRVSFVVVDSSGARVTIGAKGGYRASDALARMRQTVSAGVLDPLKWLDDEAAAIGGSLAPWLGPVVRLLLTVF